jgi:hypothetical protein
MIGMNSLINSNVLQKQNLSNSDNPFSLFN